MITITPELNRFKVKFSDPGSGSRGYHVMADSLDEVHEAINHYHRHGPRAAQHSRNSIEHCPLCRMCRDQTAEPIKLRKRPRLKVLVGGEEETEE
jgi:hypothetical protein